MLGKIMTILVKFLFVIFNDILLKIIFLICRKCKVNDLHFYIKDESKRIMYKLYYYLIHACKKMLYRSKYFLYKKFHIKN